MILSKNCSKSQIVRNQGYRGIEHSVDLKKNDKMRGSMVAIGWGWMGLDGIEDLESSDLCVSEGGTCESGAAPGSHQTCAAPTGASALSELSDVVRAHCPH